MVLYAQQEQAKAETKPEEKKAEKTEEKKEEPKPPSPFVLFVDLHCVGCAKKIERSILNIKGTTLSLSLYISLYVWEQGTETGLWVIDRS